MRFNINAKKFLSAADTLVMLHNLEKFYFRLLDYIVIEIEFSGSHLDSHVKITIITISLTLIVHLIVHLLYLHTHEIIIYKAFLFVNNIVLIQKFRIL